MGGWRKDGKDMMEGKRERKEGRNEGREGEREETCPQGKWFSLK